MRQGADLNQCGSGIENDLGVMRWDADDDMKTG